MRSVGMVDDSALVAMLRQLNPRVMPTTKPLLYHETSEGIIKAFFTVYNALGYGFLEGVYANALERELKELGHIVKREVNSVIRYRSVPIGHYRLDMIVDGCVVVEIKSTEVLAKTIERQVYNYLRATDYEVGLTLHFGPSPSFKRYLCTKDRKLGYDLRRGHTESLIPATERPPELPESSAPPVESAGPARNGSDP